MRSVEVSDKTIEAAKEAALEQLGVPEDRVQFEVLRSPDTAAGLPGSAEYVIRATIAEDADSPEGTSMTDKASPAQTDGFPEAPQISDRDSRLQQIAERACQLTTDIIGLMGAADGKVTLTGTTDREIALDISTENAGMIIGRHGDTLDALQLIVAIGANKGFIEGARVILDTEGYRSRHVESLQDMARSYADRAREKDQELVIEGLNAYERRIIHMTLRDDPDVETYSEGDGNDRVLVISPTATAS